ncbi:MFS transporter [Paenarthrobacter sp. NPDC057981]|uniref:MFS transporter n=1 Tax=Paenarthrobacter sp. NPDC057981 TaxID=3346297 RepID=UPI0036DC6684
MTTETPAATRAASDKLPRKAFYASLLGSTLEYYDFFIYGSAAALVFNHIFFSSDNPAAATIASLLTFGVAYIARPLGGIILGHFGDRIGRKRILLFTVVLMGVASTGIGLLPTYDQIGIWAPVLLTLLRIVQGISAGGESAGATSLTLEYAPDHRRGLFTSSAVMGSQSGIALGTLVFIPVAALPEDQLLAWGWRIPFLISVVVLLLAYWFRRALEETPEFQKTVAKDEIKELPVVTVLRTNWRSVVRVTIAQSWSAMGTMFSVFMLAYATSKAVGIDRPLMLTISTVAVGLAVFTIPLIAMVSDRIGRKPVLIFATLGAIATTYLLFWSFGTGNMWLIAAASFVCYSIFMAAWNAVWPAFFGEMFSTPVRYTGIAMGTQFGLLIVGFTPAILGLIVPAGSVDWLPAAIFMTIVLVIAGIAIVTAKETAKVSTEQLGRNR